MELRDALDGTISDQDASDLAVAIKQGGGGGGGHRGELQGKHRPGNRRNFTDAFDTDSEPKVRVSTGELSKRLLVRLPHLSYLRPRGTVVVP